MVYHFATEPIKYALVLRARYIAALRVALQHRFTLQLRFTLQPRFTLQHRRIQCVLFHFT